VVSGANEVLEIQSSISRPMQNISERPAVPEMAKDEFAGPPKKMWCSMPNIHIKFDANDTTTSKCIPMIQVLANAENVSVKPELDQITDLGTVADQLTATTVEKDPAAVRCGNERKNVFVVCFVVLDI